MDGDQVSFSGHISLEKQAIKICVGLPHRSLPQTFGSCRFFGRFLYVLTIEIILPTSYTHRQHRSAFPLQGLNYSRLTSTGVASGSRFLLLAQENTMLSTKNCRRLGKDSAEALNKQYLNVYVKKTSKKRNTYSILRGKHIRLYNIKYRQMYEIVSKTVSGNLCLHTWHFS